MAQFKVNGRIRGVSELLQSNPTHQHPSDPLYKLIRPIQQKRMKTEEDHEALAKFGFLTSAHWKVENLEDGVEIDNNGRVHFDGFEQPMMPADSLKASFGEASKALMNRKGSAFDRGVLIHDDFEIRYDGPKKCNGMWDARLFRNHGGSRNGGKLVWITRVCIPAQWEVDFEMFVDTTQIELSTLEEMIVASGKFIGVGSWRPANGGRFGRYTLDEMTAQEMAGV